MTKAVLAGIPALVLGLAWALAGAQPPTTPPAQDEAAIRQAVAGYLAAYNKGDLDAVLACWAPDADYVDEAGRVFKGRAALAEVFRQGLAEYKGHKLSVKTSQIRFLRPDVALEDGALVLTGPDGAVSDTSRYTAVWSRTDGKWLLASVRDLPDEPAAEPAGPAARLRELEWLVGEWSHEEPNLTVQVAVRWALDRHYLVQEYTVRHKDQEALSVIQWMGWDPQANGLRTWFFDSRGGHGTGLWARDGQQWTGECTGVLADGRACTARHGLQFLNHDAFLWTTRDREIAGQPAADAEVKFTRKTAKP